VIVPGSLHYIFAGLRIALGRALIGTVVAEIEASVVGVGNLISVDAQTLQMDQMFVPIILLGVFSLGCTTLLKFGERWTTMPWTRTRSLPWLSRS
jgi:sulfonate transport system permease protein